MATGPCSSELVEPASTGTQTHLLYNANVYVQIKLISIVIYIINNIELLLRYTNMIHVFI